MGDFKSPLSHIRRAGSFDDFKKIQGGFNNVLHTLDGLKCDTMKNSAIKDSKRSKKHLVGFRFGIF